MQRTSIKMKAYGAVGFVLLAVVMIILFLAAIGVVSWKGTSNRYFLVYDFAGGVELGSPVRVAGLKVGKVETYRFLTDGEREKFPDSSVVVEISVSKESKHLIRDNSKFYVNMAGIIGERYVEASSGGISNSELPDRSWVRGIDPPRVDQLLSQGYGVFGKVIDFIDANEKTIQEFLSQLTHLISDANQILKSQDKKRLLILLENMESISTDMRYVFHRMTEKDVALFFERLSRLVEKGDRVDKEALKKFFQDEGIRTRLF